MLSIGNVRKTAWLHVCVVLCMVVIHYLIKLAVCYIPFFPEIKMVCDNLVKHLKANLLETDVQNFQMFNVMFCSWDFD